MDDAEPEKWLSNKALIDIYVDNKKGNMKDQINKILRHRLELACIFNILYKFQFFNPFSYCAFKY